MATASLVFPHQLFKKLTLPKGDVYLIEDELYFNQFKFHKQKIAFHRSSMQYYADFLQKEKHQVHYVAAQEAEADVRKLLPKLAKEGIKQLHYIDTTDNWLERRLKASAEKAGIKLHQHPTQLFLNQPDELEKYFGSRDRYYQTKFYMEQRKSRGLLLTPNGEPMGGKWSFDAENRLRYPKKKLPPHVNYPKPNKYYKEAVQYTQQHYNDNYGELTELQLYPATHKEAETWLEEFLNTRFAEFGPYEDAIVAKEAILNHSVLSPLINVGLLTPQQVIEAATDFAEKNNVPINTTEGFVRQIAGWREFIRAVYEYKGSYERTRNFWGFSRKIPESFWTGETGMVPIDMVIKKVLRTGYCHHIERLMVLGNFMLLCEFHPDEVYGWFMELFIDAYDWVMVPNVYGMSQFADGGIMATKPYVGGSNYLRKMSDFPKGDWQATWDGLFWRFLHVNHEVFARNPRTKGLLTHFERMDDTKRNTLLGNAEAFLAKLDGK